MESYGPDQHKVFLVSASIMRWITDPVFLCGTAVMVEFLERIWRQLAKTNARHDGQ